MNRVNLRLFLTAGVCVALLSGCSWLKSPLSDDAEEIKPPEPQVKLVQTADATWIEPESATPPVERMVPEPSETYEQSMKRLRDLEDQVSAMRNDISTMAPALTKMAETQVAMRNMIEKTAREQEKAQMQMMAATPPPAPTPPVTAPPQPLQPAVPLDSAQNPYEAPQPAASTSAPAPQPAVASGKIIKQVRFGEHPGKTRIVFDTTGNIEFSYDIDNKEKLLVIDMKGAAWAGPTQGQTHDSPLVTSWQAMSDGQGGTRVAIVLRRSSQILLAQALPGSGGKDARIVVDLMGL